MKLVFLLAANVTRTSPSFHNPGHIRLWNESSLRSFNPHILMVVLAAIIIAALGYFLYFKRKNQIDDSIFSSEKEENEFQYLVTKKKVILNKIVQLEEDFKAGNISEVELNDQKEAYRKHLIEVKLKLKKYID